MRHLPNPRHSYKGNPFLESRFFETEETFLSDSKPKNKLDTTSARAETSRQNLYSGPTTAIRLTKERTREERQETQHTSTRAEGAETQTLHPSQTMFADVQEGRLSVCTRKEYLSQISMQACTLELYLIPEIYDLGTNRLSALYKVNITHLDFSEDL